ncbi:hypothetical protein L195_g032798 [Trifolium pratense]|uniref:Uncharacterized protein n=1 Tax=Trifolium pratense TaxID=57577 RepID=A0A2K3LE67_TRIPR|nr:hypothetical protein L195_g032798 [Trifolium pratense]
MGYGLGLTVISGFLEIRVNSWVQGIGLEEDEQESFLRVRLEEDEQEGFQGIRFPRCQILFPLDIRDLKIVGSIRGR